MPSQLPRSARVHNSSVGQVAEWLVWSQLAASSSGDLHTFLPLKDEGVDGIVHRISTDRYARVQVKGYGPRNGLIEVRVPEHELVDDLGFIVAVALDEEGPKLGSQAFVMEIPEFRQLASRFSVKGRWFYAANVHLEPPGDRWHSWCVPVSRIGDRLLPASAEYAAAAPVPDGWVAAGHLGLRAEMEFLRRCADCDRLNAFKAFPDLEPNEYVLYDLLTHGLVGVQVKAITLRTSSDEATLNVYRPALRPSPLTWFTLFLAHEAQPDFLDYCAVMPSSFVAEHLAGRGVYGKLCVPRGLSGRLAPGRVPLSKLGERLAEVAAEAHVNAGQPAQRN